jgi:hypothetical protein
MTSTARNQVGAHTDRETITDRLETIGSVTGNAVDGWHAFDSDGRLIETFSTKPAARAAIFERHRGEYRR